ncbi:MAG: S8 family serine peptidase [Xenococcus sp. MO_188.B8]|nr:S8 family serine peptidase [Xenococcus sp. MO_188.B8]
MARNWAIAIGINQYDNLPNLKYAVRDAESMKDWFESEAGFDKVYLFTDTSPPITDGTKPYSSQPSRATLRRFLRVRFEQPFLSAGDNLWFFFSGHGMRYANRDYLMPSHVDPHPEELESSAIPLAYVTERLRRCGADNIVLILDACRDEEGSKGLGVGEEKQQGVITIVSCSPAERSYEIEELQQGSFTYSLLRGLRIQGEGNCATVERLSHYLRHQVPEINRIYQKPRQTPYAIAEPATKYHLILLPEYATLKDAETLKWDASNAELNKNYSMAEQLWIRVLVVSPGDQDAIAGIRRLGPETTIVEPQVVRPRIDKICNLLNRNFFPTFNLKRRRLLQIIGFAGTGIGVAFLVRTIPKLKPKSQARTINDLVKQTALQNINVPQAIEESGSNPVKIAILADGVSPYLIEVLGDRILEGKSFISGETIFNSENDHGTLVSSIVAAIAPKAIILPVKVLANKGSGADGGILSGIRYAIEDKADILLMAFGASVGEEAPESIAYKQIFQEAQEEKILPIAPAGSHSPSQKFRKYRPAFFPNVLAVAATDNQGQLADLSNFGEWVSLAAPGVNITSFGLNWKPQSFSSSNISAAIAAGVVALMLSVNPNLTPDEIEEILQETSTNKSELKQKIASGQIDALAAVKKVKSEFPTRVIYDLVKQTALQNINIPKAIEESGSNPVKIAILADGVSSYLIEVIGDRILEGKSFISGETIINSENNHGLLVHSIVAAVAPKATILPVIVLGNSRGGHFEEILEGIKYAIEEQADILLMPFGATLKEEDLASLSTVYKRIFKKAKTAKSLSIAAAGINSSSEREYPAAVPDVLAVTATDNQGQLANFSSYGEWVSIAVPGVNITSIGLDGKPQSISGSSYSAAIAAGVAALMLSVNPDLTPDEIEEILQETSTNKSELQQKIASGQIDALAAVKKVKSQLPAQAVYDLVKQPELQNINIPQAIAESASNPVKIAILAEGVSSSFKQILGARILEGKSFVYGETATDSQSIHGTSLSSIVVAVAPKATILPVKVLKDNGSGSNSVILQGIEYAIEEQADILLMPIGGRGVESTSFDSIFKKAKTAKSLSIAAAGINSSSKKEYPAALPYVLALAATDNQGQLADFSNYGEWVSLAAPGVDITCIGLDGKTETSISGSSYSAAIAAGVAALMLSINPDLTPNEIEKILQETSTNKSELQQKIASGQIDALAAVKKAKSEFPSRRAISELVQQPALQNIKIPQAIAESGSNSVKIAILADGVSPFFIEVLGDRILEGKSFISGETIINSENDHGTLVSSIVAAVAPKATILPVKVLANKGFGGDSGIRDGIEYAMEEQADILLMPFGAPSGELGKSPAFDSTFQKAELAKILSISTAGDDSSFNKFRPAARPYVLAVTATDNQGQLADFSNFGKWVSLAAPGVNITSFGLNWKPQSFSSSNISAAIAAGVAALMLSVNPDLTPDEIEKILQETSTNKSELQQKIASGQIDALAAVKKAKNYK